MLILASASKARLELLGSVGISPDKILNTNIDETPKKSEKPLDYVSRIALEKNRSVKKKKIEIVIWILWLTLVILWNYGYPEASPFFDVIVAIVLSIINIFIIRILKS